MSDLNRSVVVERRAKCVVCGYVLSYPEYIQGDKCIFHSDSNINLRLMSLWNWIRYAIAEYRVMEAKLKMKAQGMTEKDYFGCLGNVAPEIEDIKDSETMGLLFKKLKKYKVTNA